MSWSGALLRRFRLRRGERGAALVEAAVVLPLVFTLVMGLVECGLTFRDYLTLANMTRSGARVISTAGSDAKADFQALQAASSSSTAINLSSINTIVIFKAESADGTPTSKLPAGCLTASQPGICNHYTAADISRTTDEFGCSSCIDSAYSPVNRRDAQSGAGPERVGVYISINHKWISGMFGKGGFVMSDTTVMRIEPARK